MTNLKHYIKSTVLLLFLLVSSQGNSQELGFEFQVYPTGIIPTLNFTNDINDRWSYTLRAGLNIFDHRDLGVQDDEEGSGYGFGLGINRFLGSENTKWRLGLNTDVWFNSVEWMDGIEDPSPTMGETDITVLQPTAELSYFIYKGSWSIAPSLSFGFEWNIKTEGEPTGEGAILLVGIQVSKKF